jgi:hypothetical protein
VTSITIVSGMLDLGRGVIAGWGQRPYSFYLDSLTRLMRRYREIPMVLHVAPSDEPLVWSSRRRANTKVVHVSIETLRAMPYAARVDAIRTSARWVAGADWLRDSPQRLLEGYLPFVLAKPLWLRDAAIADNFATRHFIWIDAGLSANPFYAHLSRARFIARLNLDGFGAVCVPYTTNTEIHGFDRRACAAYCGVDFVSWLVRGALFGGTREAIQRVGELYAALMAETLTQGHLGTEETLLTILAHRHPELIHRRSLSMLGLRLRAMMRPSYRGARVSRYLPRSPQGLST